MNAGYFQDIGGRLFPVDPEIPIWMPQDEEELHRLDHEHTAIKLVVGGNYLGPTASHLRYEPGAPRKRVLDIGTQQGSWLANLTLYVHLVPNQSPRFFARKPLVLKISTNPRNLATGSKKWRANLHMSSS